MVGAGEEAERNDLEVEHPSASKSQMAVYQHQLWVEEGAALDVSGVLDSRLSSLTSLSGGGATKNLRLYRLRAELFSAADINSNFRREEIIHTSITSLDIFSRWSWTSRKTPFLYDATASRRPKISGLS
jgi:hypothetical protein